MIIDANLYWMPEELFRDAVLLQKFIVCANAYGVYASVQEIADTGKKQIVIEKPKGCQNLNYAEGEYEAVGQLADMDAAGVDLAILKTPGCQEWLDLELCKVFNDGMAEHVRKAPSRFHALAVVPPYGTEANLAELERCVNELGINGVQLSAHYGDKYLDDEAFRPFFRKVSELNLTVYVHHTGTPIESTYLQQYNNLRRSYGRCADQNIAVGRELFSGLFEEFPNLRVVHSMLGGGFFGIMNLMMLKPHTSHDTVKRFDFSEADIKLYLQRNVFFEMSHAEPWGKASLESAIRILGADHVVFGSSYPVRKPWLLDGPSFVRDLDISREDQDMVLGGAAEKIYDIAE